MLFYNIFAVALGGALGASLRYLISLKFNAYLDVLPLGTLIVNLTGAYLIGVFLSWFSDLPDMAQFMRLFVITGCLGALTTFSTFSAEIVSMLNHGNFYNAVLAIFLHLFGSIIMVFCGIYSWNFIKDF